MGGGAVLGRVRRVQYFAPGVAPGPKDLTLPQGQRLGGPAVYVDQNKRNGRRFFFSRVPLPGSAHAFPDPRSLYCEG